MTNCYLCLNIGSMTQDLNRTLFVTDCLQVLQGIDSGTIDLIATDPPFNKATVFEGVSAEGKKFTYEDMWVWNEDQGEVDSNGDVTVKGAVDAQWALAIAEHHPRLHAVLLGAREAAGQGMHAYLTWLAIRLLEMHRILKKTGSLYLHCDTTASHYIKLALDVIFQCNQFRNEVIWHYPNKWAAAKREFAHSYDSLLIYSKSSSRTFHAQRKAELTGLQKKRAQHGWAVEGGTKGSITPLVVYDKTKAAKRIEQALREGRRIHYVTDLQGLR